MKPGTIIELPDKRRGTVVYNGLDGVGIKWGEHKVDEAEILEKCPLFDDEPIGWEWSPDAMLRDPYKGCELECVGDEYEVIS